jgi:hypothetical protein
VLAPFGQAEVFGAEEAEGGFVQLVEGALLDFPDATFGEAGEGGDLLAAEAIAGRIDGGGDGEAELDAALVVQILVRLVRVIGKLRRDWWGDTAGAADPLVTDTAAAIRHEFPERFRGTAGSAVEAFA